MSNESRRNHVLLIGVDAYPDRPLAGCVNDVVTMYRMLRDKLGIDTREITVLASPRPSMQMPDDVRVNGQATAAEIRGALDRLASEQVSEVDRVIIHYSGHGGTQEINGQRRRSIESLLPTDYRDDGGTIHDIEVNRRLARIAERTRNLTVVLDCCHSGGASRDPDYTIRSLVLPSTSEAAIAQICDETKANDGRGLGRRIDGEPLVVAACLADELAGETRQSGVCMGLLTRSLTSQIEAMTAEELALCSWRELWPTLLAAAEPQHPWLIGDDRRQLFGLAPGRSPGDVRVKPRVESGDYEVFAGSLLDVTEGAEIAVFDANDEQQAEAVGTLRVESASRAVSIARAVTSFAWPKRPRCRIVRHGQPRLSVAIEGALPDAIGEQLGRLGIQRVEAGRPDVDVRLVAVDGRWVLCDELFGLASEGVPELPRFADESIASVLTHCVEWRAPLRLARRCTDLPGALSLRLLDESTPSSNPQDPSGPDLAGTGWPRYRVEFGQKFCIEVSNDARVPLQVTLLNVAADGQVQLLGDSTTVLAGRSHGFWMGELGNPFELGEPAGFERVVAIGTTRRDQNFRHLVIEEGFEQAIARTRNVTRNFKRFERPEQWTATVVAIASVAPGDQPK